MKRRSVDIKEAFGKPPMSALDSICMVWCSEVVIVAIDKLKQGPPLVVFSIAFAIIYTDSFSLDHVTALSDE